MKYLLSWTRNAAIANRLSLRIAGLLRISCVWVTGPTNRKNWLTFGGDPIPDTDSGSPFHFPHQYGVGILGDLLAFFVQLPAEFHDTRRND